VGTGATLIALPVFPHEGVLPFRLKLSTTVEVLEFAAIGAIVPNRGFSQPDIEIHGLRYLQRVADGITHEPLHIEPGLWLNVPASQASQGSDEVVRQSTIPHGNSVLALGSASEQDLPPIIPPTLSVPTNHAGHPRHPVGNRDYLAPYDLAKTDETGLRRPTGFAPAWVGDPSQALRDVLEAQEARHQTIVHTTILDVSTGPHGHVSNIPTDVATTSLDATLWIERVEETIVRPDGGRAVKGFLQLQYSQTALLDFDDIVWPHISVATLTKQ
jgi:hypothetical protein